VKETLRPLAERYGSALEAFVTGGGEEARSRGYEIGRTAVADHVGLLEIAELHHEVLETVMRRTPARWRPLRSSSARSSPPSRCRCVDIGRPTPA